MGRDETREWLAKLDGKMEASAKASEDWHREHRDRDRITDRHLRALTDRIGAVEGEIKMLKAHVEDGTRIAAAFGEQQVEAGRERDERLGHVEATNEHQKGQRQSMVQGLGWSIAIVGILAASVISIVTQVLRNNGG